MNSVIYILGISAFMGKDENRLHCVTLHFLSKKKKTPACLVHHLKCVNFSSNSKFLYDSVSLGSGDLCQYKQTKQCGVPCYRYNCELVHSQPPIKVVMSIFTIQQDLCFSLTLDSLTASRYFSGEQSHRPR